MKSCRLSGGDDSYKGDQNEQPTVLLLRVMKANGKPFPIGRFTGRAMSQMLHEIAGVVPNEVVIMNDQEVVMELDKEMFDGCFRGNTWIVPLGRIICKCRQFSS